MALKRIAIEIGEVVLHGVAPSDRHRVADALRAQLERVLAEPGTQAALARASSVQRLDLPAIHVSGRMRAEPLGAATADALIAGLRAMAADAQPATSAAASPATAVEPPANSTVGSQRMTDGPGAPSARASASHTARTAAPTEAR